MQFVAVKSHRHGGEVLVTDRGREYLRTLDPAFNRVVWYSLPQVERVTNSVTLNMAYDVFNTISVQSKPLPWAVILSLIGILALALVGSL